MKKTISIIIWIFILVTLVIYHYVSVSDLSRDYEDLSIVYENCVKFRQDYVLTTDSIFLEYEDSMKVMNLKIEALRAEVTK